MAPTLAACQHGSARSPPSAAAELVRAARNLVRSSTRVKRAKVLSAGGNRPSLRMHQLCSGSAYIPEQSEWVSGDRLHFADASLLEEPRLGTAAK